MRHDSNVNLAWLSAFDAAARHLNFTKAAEELGLSQGAISIQIRKLEHVLNASLFERRGRHVVLTDEGLAYHPHVREALEALSLTTSRMFSRQGRNVVTISCYSPTFSDHWITPRLPALIQEIPELELNLIVDYQASFGRSERNDLVITYESGEASAFVPLVQETLVAVCTPDYLSKFGPNWSRGVLIESAGPRVTWPMWRTAVRVDEPLDGRVVQVNALGSALRLARLGAGVALAALPYAAKDLETGTLVEVCPGKRLVDKIHGFSAPQLEMARPQVKRTARWLLESAGQPVPHYLL